MVSPSPEPPSFTVRISDPAVRHIRDTHVNDRREGPLWAEFLAPQPDIALALEPEIQRSLARPLYLEYDQYDEEGVFLHRTREFVTRAGIVVVVRLVDEHSGDVVTAYFPYETFEARRQRRWIAARESRILEYGVRVTFGLAQTVLAPPSSTDVFPSVDPAGERRNVRFVNDERWGIRTMRVLDADLRVFVAPPPWPEQ
jgi:hypothetical protein